MKKSSAIALLTDFGTMDAYVASMHGVILSIAPHTKIIDISHSIEPQNIDEAAYILWTTYRFFPKGTIFLSVVDPGVGSNRDIICVETGDYWFIAPDNGLLKYVLAFLHRPRIISVKNQAYFLPHVSTTFHGRDIFAPIAAHLANGLTPSKLGPRTTPLYHAEQFVHVDPAFKATYDGRIIHVDYFGNIITNILVKEAKGSTLTLTVGKRKIVKNYPSYAEAPPRKLFLIVGSSGLLEIVVKNGNATEYIEAPVRSRVRLNVS